VPPGSSDEYIGALAEVAERERPDVLFVQSSAEVGPIAAARARFEGLGARVLVASPEAIALCGDKAAMHATLVDRAVPQPETFEVRSLDEFVSACERLGYPGRPVCFKPPVSKGSRGFRVLRPDVDRASVLGGRHNGVVMDLDETVAAFRSVESFPRLLVMEYLDGPEHTVDALAAGGEILLHQAKTREEIATGLAMSFRTLARPDLVDFAREACRALALDWFVNLQFKGGRLLEVNPRVSTFVYQEDFVLPYLGIKYALGELDDEALAAAQARVRTSRRTLRYHEQLFWDEA
jgi:carbamoyl-phosphate synthase large subunit